MTVHSLDTWCLAWAVSSILSSGVSWVEVLQSLEHAISCSEIHTVWLHGQPQFSENQSRYLTMLPGFMVTSKKHFVNAWCGARGSYRGGLGTLCSWTIFLMWWKWSSRDWSRQDGILHSSLDFQRTWVSVAVNVEQVIYSSENWCFLYPLAFPGCMLQYPWGSCWISSCSWGIQRRVEMDKSS